MSEKPSFSSLAVGESVISSDIQHYNHTPINQLSFDFFSGLNRDRQNGRRYEISQRATLEKIQEDLDRERSKVRLTRSVVSRRPEFGEPSDIYSSTFCRNRFNHGLQQTKAATLLRDPRIPR